MAVAHALRVLHEEVREPVGKVPVRDDCINVCTGSGGGGGRHNISESANAGSQPMPSVDLWRFHVHT